MRHRVLGPNGAGKTTTLGILLGLVAPDAGMAAIGGRSYAAWPSPGRAAGVVLEAAGFHPGRSGRDHLRVYWHGLRLPARPRR